MALIPTVVGKVKSIERDFGHSYYKVKIVATCTRCYTGYHKDSSWSPDGDQTLFSPYAESARDVAVGDLFSVLAFPLSESNTWECEGGVFREERCQSG